MVTKFGLRKKLILLITGIVFLTVVLSGIATFTISRKVLLDRTRSQIVTISVLKEGTIKNYVNNAKDKIEAFAKIEHRRELLIPLLKKYNNNDKELVINEYFPELIEGGYIFRVVTLMNLDGVVIASSRESDIGKIKTNEEYFIGGLNETTIQSFYYDPITSETAIVISTPIKDEMNMTLGVLGGMVSIQEINKLMIERSGLGKSGETFLINRSNLVITELLKAPGVALKKTIFLPQINRCLEGNSNFEGITDYYGDQVYGYWYWFPEIKSCMVTKIDKNEALSPLYQIVYVLLIISTMIALLVGIIGYGVGNVITKPIISLRNMVIKIKDGDFNSRASTTSNDEIGEMSVAINQMAEKLDISYGDLEKKVEDATKSEKQKRTIAENLYNKLKERSKEVEAQNITLGKNKAAIINLLEDSKTLEKELKLEKESVEKKIVERTKELNNEKSKLTASIEALSKAFVMMDLNGNIILTNENLNKIFGENKKNWKLNEIQDKFGTSFNFIKVYQETLKDNKRIEYDDIELGSKYFQVRFSPVYSGLDEQRRVTEVLAIIGDVTEEKVLERSKDEFFSIASHELRTPLTAIRGNTSMILDYYKDQIKDPELKLMITDTHDASVRLIGIVNDFLDLSRLEQKRMEYKLTKFKLLDVVLTVLNDLKVSAISKNIKLDTDIDKNIEVVADIDKVKQVLFNIVGNSLKFTDKGNVTIESVVMDKLVKVRIIDTGLGIPPTNQKLLFHKFQQAASSTITRDGAKGTGLGLYISKLIVEGMGGTINLESSVEGQGSVFTFTLPIAKVK